MAAVASLLDLVSETNCQGFWIIIYTIILIDH